MNQNPFDPADTGPHFRNLVGAKCGRLTVVRYFGRKNHERLWECVCSCAANGVIVLPSCRITGKNRTMSCGCLRAEATAESCRTHGMSGHELYGVWRAMIARCNGRGRLAHYYSGIRVCAGLASSPAAIERSIGVRPQDMTIDRTNNLGSYTCGECQECVVHGWPKNIRWATMAQQLRNTRRNVMVTICGVSKCVQDWCAEAGISDAAFRYRLRRGVGGKDLLRKPSSGPKWIAAMHQL